MLVTRMFLTYQLKENIKENLLWLRDHNELCDIILILGNCKVSAHSCVLASHSPVLAAILQARLFVQNDWSILKPLIISLDNEDKCSDSSDSDSTETSILDLLISFIYGETIAVEETRIQELRDLSKLLGLAQHFTDCIHSGKSKDEIEDPSPVLSKCKSVENIVTETVQDHDRIANSENSSDKSVDNTKIVNELKTCRRLKNINKVKNIKNIKCRKSKTIKPPIIEFVNPTLQEKKISIKYKLENAAEDVLFSETNSTPVDSSNSFNDAELWFENELFNADNIKINKCEDEENIEIETQSERLLLSKKCNKNHLKRATRIAFFCSVCKSSFQRANDLINHVKEENHFCQICQLCFLQLNEYEEQKNHFDQHDHPLPFFCMCCELRFRTRAGLAMHSPKHSNTKPYTCKECGRGFKWRHSAQAHSITHRSHCHLLCDVCGFSSKYASTFQSHLKRHYGQSIPCPHPGCKFKSFRKTHLNDHLATHAKLRSHQCEVCGHSFSQAKNLKRHMRLHTPDTSFLKCASYSDQNCPFKTTRPDKLRFHLIQKHNLKCPDKISLPDTPSSFIPLVKSQNSSEEDGKKNIVPDNKNTEKLEVPLFNNFDLGVQEFKESEDSYLEDDCRVKQLSEDKMASANTMSIDVNELILDEQNSDIRAEERIDSSTVCFSDSYETYIVPATSQDDSMIVSENIEYTNRNNSLVLMGDYEVLEDISPEVSRLSAREEHVSTFVDEKRDEAVDKIDDIMDGLPVILQASSESDFADNNIEYELNRHADVSLENDDRNIQLLKLPDGSIEFLSHIQDDSSSMQQSSTSVINLYTSDENRNENEENFKEYNSTPFNLNSLF